MVRLQDVARKAGLSLSVASRALTNDPLARISDETRKRVWLAAEELGYVPDQRARALRLSRSGAIALVVPEVNDSIFMSVYAGVQQVCADRQVAVLLGQIDGSDIGRATALSTLIGKGRVDGVVMQRSGQFTDEDLSDLIRVGVPVILFNSSLPSHTGSVALDDAAAVRVALGQLRDLGHRRVGFIGGPSHHDAATRRRVAFGELAADWGITPASGWDQPCGWDAASGHAAMSTLVELEDPPSAVLVASFNAGLGALAAAREHGIEVPGQVSVIAIQDTWIAAYTSPPLTTVMMPMELAGARAATMLLDHLDGSELANIVFDDPAPLLVPRCSTSS